MKWFKVFKEKRWDRKVGWISAEQSLNLENCSISESDDLITYFGRQIWINKVWKRRTLLKGLSPIEEKSLSCRNESRSATKDEDFQSKVLKSEVKLFFRCQRLTFDESADLQRLKPSCQTTFWRLVGVILLYSRLRSGDFSSRFVETPGVPYQMTIHGNAMG